jgi:small subunit ribosomal protein S27Ae
MMPAFCSYTFFLTKKSLQYKLTFYVYYIITLFLSPFIIFLDIQKEATLHLVLRLRGGGKKRKKKTYSKPKKIKRKHKTVKLAVLKYYKVDGDKVERLRKSCPQEGCGPGILMAQHYDRLYCGKCHYRIVVADEK